MSKEKLFGAGLSVVCGVKYRVILDTLNAARSIISRSSQEYYPQLYLSPDQGLQGRYPSSPIVTLPSTLAIVP